MMKESTGQMKGNAAGKRLSRVNLRAQLTIYIAFALAVPSFVNAAVFNVAAGNAAALTAAITNANNNGQDDEIVLAAGTYSLSAVDNNTEGPNGLPTITSSIVFSVTGTGPAIIERAPGAPAFRIFYVAPPSGDLVLDGLIVTGGNAPGTGGGILNEGMLEVTDSVISGNVSGSGGGGIRNRPSGTLIITNSAIRMNRNGIFGGGGISSGGTATLDKSTVSDNTSGAGGGTGGAGIFNTGGTLTITNSTISGNRNSSGNGRGGGINNGGTLNLNNVTITNNTAQIEGGGLNHFGTGTANLKNTIIAGNFDTGGTFSSRSPDCDGTLTSQGFNLIGNTGSASTTSPTPPACVIITALGDLVGTESSPINPRLEPLADNGGPTQTHALTALFDFAGALITILSSPAIDNGNPTQPGSGGDACESTDQRSFIRPADGDEDGAPVCDIGAFELEAQPPPSVTCDGQSLTMTCTVNGVPNQLCQGTSGPDTIIGTDGRDVIHGLDDNDIIEGRRGGDTICGGADDDRLFGQRGDDSLFGQRGDDFVDGGRGTDTCKGGAGNDAAVNCE